MKDKVALFGGGFNPICSHHEHIARLISRHTEMPVLLMPCYQHLFSKNNDLLDASHRWNMVEEVCDGQNMVAFDWEISHQHSGSMCDTMAALVNEHPDTEFSIVIGTDNANIVETDWVLGGELINLYPFIVVRRQITCPVCKGNKFQCAMCDETGLILQPETTDWFKKPPHMTLEFAHPGSSTATRKAIAEGRHGDAMRNLNALTWDYIQSGNLFGYEEKTS